MTYRSLLSITPEVLGTPCIALLGPETYIDGPAARAAQQQRLSVTRENLSLLSDLADQILLLVSVCPLIRHVAL